MVDINLKHTIYTIERCILMSELWQDVGFILSSEYRKKILFALEDTVKTPKELSKLTNIQINHVSNILKELLDKSYTECKNPEARKGRLYTLTIKGKDLLKKIKKL
jgi:predicted transcriptional regulator